jgi:uncharacterized protein YybS (DUF2232 family)
MLSVAPTYWGPSFWEVFHSIAFWFPAEPDPRHKKAAVDFYTSMAYLLPCHACQVHYKEILQNHSIENHVHSRMALLKWTIDVHNMVNSSLGKDPLPIDEAVLLIEKQATRPSPSKRMPGQLIVLAIILAFGAGFVASTALKPRVIK